MSDDQSSQITVKGCSYKYVYENIAGFASWRELGWLSWLWTWLKQGGWAAWPTLSCFAGLVGLAGLAGWVAWAGLEN